MKVTIVQTSLFWEDREKNLAHLDTLLAPLKGRSNLIVLPEMFTTGFSMQPEKVAEDHQGRTFEWMLQKARETNAILTGSVAVKEGHNYYNRLHWIEPGGSFSFYDKRHLFRLAKEDEKYIAGKQKILKQVGEWSVMPLICYDLRFPVWSRNFQHHEPMYDVLIYVANWPEVRSYPWKQLLIARAIENQCYVIGVNRIGQDGNGYEHSGDSVVINPKGEVISSTRPNEESVETIELDRDYLLEFRKVFPVALDSDDFELK